MDEFVGITQSLGDLLTTWGAGQSKVKMSSCSRPNMRANQH